MCGRYVSPDEASIEREFTLLRTEWQFPPSFNVAPTQQVPVIRQFDGELQGSCVRWGLIPFFTKGEPPKYSTINARIETVETAALYRGPWKRGQRCLQLANGFFEWHLDGEGRKRPYYIHLADQPIFAFARGTSSPHCGAAVGPLLDGHGTEMPAVKPTKGDGPSHPPHRTKYYRGAAQLDCLRCRSHSNCGAQLRASR